MAGYLSSGIIFGILTRRKFIFLIAYSIVLVGVIGMLFTNKHKEYEKENFALKYLSKFGVAAAYQGVFLMMGIFPRMFYSTTFGICLTFGIIMTIVGSQGLTNIGDDSQFIRLFIGMSVCLISLLVSPFLIGSHRIKL